MSLVNVFLSFTITLTLSAQAFANCNASCGAGPNTQAPHVAYCKILTNGGTTIMASGKTLSQEQCEDANAIFGCVWKSSKQEQLKCFGGANPTEVAVCKQQNNLPSNIVGLACDNLSVVSKCQYDYTCD